MRHRRAVFIHSHKLEEYSYPSGFPLNTSRAGKVRKIIDSIDLLGGPDRREVPPQPADRITLKKFHSARYLHALKLTDSGRFDPEAIYMGMGSSDCPVFKGMYDYSVLACGATLTAADMILTDRTDLAFNPSGGFHHAGPERASGFCYINDVALAATVLAEAGKKVLYLDIDVHHGDGVQNAFYDRNDVMTISMHESGRTLFPGTGFADETGTADGKGFCVNVPLPVGTYDTAYMKVFKAVVEPLIAAYSPDIIVFVLGADGLASDPLAHLQLTNNTYAEIIEVLLGFNKPILMTGVGGYNIDDTVRAWALAWSVLIGAKAGNLLDSRLPVTKQQRAVVESAVEATIEAVKTNVFAIHGL